MQRVPLKKMFNHNLQEKGISNWSMYAHTSKAQGFKLSCCISVHNCWDQILVVLHSWHPAGIQYTAMGVNQRQCYPSEKDTSFALRSGVQCRQKVPPRKPRKKTYNTV